MSNMKSGSIVNSPETWGPKEEVQGDGDDDLFFYPYYGMYGIPILDPKDAAKAAQKAADDAQKAADKKVADEEAARRGKQLERAYRISNAGG